MTAGVDAGLTEVVGMLRGVGIESSVDPDRVPVPGAWVRLDSIDTLTLAGDLILTVTVHLVVDQTEGPVAAIGALDHQLTKLLTLDWEPTGPVDATGALVLPESAPRPCWRVTYELTIDNESGV